MRIDKELSGDGWPLGVPFKGGDWIRSSTSCPKIGGVGDWTTIVGCVLKV